jgi:tight adherence protein C
MSQHRIILAILITLPVLLHFGLLLVDEFGPEVLELSNGVRMKKSRKRERVAIESEFPLVVELFAILIGGGMSPSTALAHISEAGDGAFVALLRPIVEEMRNGLNLAQALDILNRRVESPIIRRFCDSLAISVERGTSLIEVVARQVEEVRQAQRTAISDRASKAELSLMVPVVFLILPISILFALWPSYYSLGNGFGVGG